MDDTQRSPGATGPRNPALRNALDSSPVSYLVSGNEVEDAFVVTAFECVEELNRPFRLTIELTAEHEATDSTELLGRDVSPRMERGDAYQRVLFRAFCMRGGRPDAGTRDMVIAYPSSRDPNASETGTEADFSGTHRRRISDNGVVPITQNVAAHEFGHYVGLSHTCVSRAPSDINTSNAYCAGLVQARQEDLMAAGNILRRAHGGLWRRRLRRHHDHCERQFQIHTFADSPPQ